MADSFTGEIRIFAGNFAPAGWALCQGQLLPISEFETLFNLIGTTYGGDGQSTFALPDLRGRIPVHQGSSFVIGELSGVEDVTLTTSQMPAHTHALVGTKTLANVQNPVNETVAKSQNLTMYVQDVPDSALTPQSISVVGGSQPHDNMQPFLCINFIISLFGIYPTQN